MQTSTLAVSKMGVFMTLQLYASIRRLKSQRATSYAPYQKETFSKNKKMYVVYDRCFTGF